MSRTKAVTRLDAEQAVLFDLPEEPALVPLARRWQHNATTTMRDEARCYETCERLHAGQSVIGIARAMVMSPKTVRALRAELADGGKLAHLKERFVRRAGEFVSDALDYLHEKLLAGEMTPTEVSVGMGIVADKARDAAGVPGLLVRHEHVHAVVDAAYVAGLFGAAPESQSGVALLPAAQKADMLPAGHGSGHGSGLNPAAVEVVTVQAGADRAELATGDQGRAREGGGGREFPPGCAGVDISDSAKFETKACSCSLRTALVGDGCEVCNPGSAPAEPPTP